MKQFPILTVLFTKCFKTMNTIYGICLQSVIPMRVEPREQSEMVSQVLFGELFQVIESRWNWTFIKCDFDHYEGWVDTKNITYLSEDDYNGILHKQGIIIDKFTQANFNDAIFRILPGSTIYNYDEHNKSFEILTNIYGNVDIDKSNMTIASISKHFLNTPYLWGGKSLFGIDCSGFTQTVYKIFGISIPRDSNQQVKLGESVSFAADAKEGDLAFFDNEEGEITHVGIILNDKKIIHASGYVKIDNIDHQGIFSAKEKKYSHKLRIIKRILR